MPANRPRFGLGQAKQTAKKNKNSTGRTILSASVRPPEHLPIIEPAHVPEYLVTGLADIGEALGVVRGSFYAEVPVNGAGVVGPFTPRRRVVQVRLVCPAAAYPGIVRQAVELLDPQMIARLAHGIDA